MIEGLLFEEESATLDFKEEQYSFENTNDYQKSELLKDILAFTNAWRCNDAYILIGVKEVKGGKSTVTGIENNLDDASLQQFINSKTQRPITFEYKNTQIDGKNIAYIKIPINVRPIYINKDYGKVKKGVVYIRRGSSTAEASPDEVADMGASVYHEKNTPVLQLDLANRDEKLLLDSSVKFSTRILEFPSDETIPDYKTSRSNDTYDMMSYLHATNTNYYRELFDYYYWKEIKIPVSFCIANISDIMATDIKIEITVDSDNNSIDFIYENELPIKPSIIHDLMPKVQNFRDIQIKPDIIIKLINNVWHIDILFQKVQARQTVFTKDLVFLASKKSGKINFQYKIFGDNLPAPIEDNLHLDVDVQVWKSNLSEIQEIKHKDFLTNLSNQ